MGKLLKFQIARAVESKKLFLSIGLLVLIGISGAVLWNIYFSSEDNPNLGMLSMYNSYTQFFYLAFAYVIVSNLAGDIQSGTMTIFKYMGFSGVKVVLSKIIYYVVLFVVLIDVFIVLACFFFGVSDADFVFNVLLVLDLGLIQVILLACVLSLFIKKTSYATIVMYGLFLCLNIINLMGCGLTNQADSNSISTRFVQVSSGIVAALPPTWDGIVTCTTEQLFHYSLLVSGTWILLLFTTTLIKAKRMK